MEIHCFVARQEEIFKFDQSLHCFSLHDRLDCIEWKTTKIRENEGLYEIALRPKCYFNNIDSYINVD